jgi:hypothetical protein
MTDSFLVFSRSLPSVRLGLGLAALAFTCSLTPPAGAAPPADAEGRSRALYHEAEALANNANWVDACPLFQAAHDLHGTGGTALRTADCYEKVAKYDRALELYQWIVDHRDADKQPDRVQLAEQRVAALKKQLGLTGQTPLPPGPPPPLPPPGGTRGPIAPPPIEGPPPRVPNRVPAIAMFSVGGVGVVVGAVAGGLALSKANSVKSACGPTDHCPSQADAKSSAETTAWVSNVGFGVAVVGVVVGAVLWATGTPKKDAERTTVGADGLTLHF